MADDLVPIRIKTPFMFRTPKRAYFYEPFEDITSVELAQIAPVIPAMMLGQNLLDGAYDAWPDNVKRHFRVDGPNNHSIILPGPGDVNRLRGPKL